MRFFLAGRDRVTGSVRLVSDLTFASRQDALDSLGMLLPSDGSFDGLDLFVADIEQGTPVVVYKPVVVEPLPGMPADAPIADAWESPPEAPAMDDAAAETSSADVAVEEPYPDAVIAELEAVVAEPVVEIEPEPPEPLPLMDALRRAADRMEADGIVAPEPVGDAAVPAGDVVEPADAVPAEPVGAQWPWEAAEVAATATDQDTAAVQASDSADLDDALAGGGSGALLSDHDLGVADAYVPAGAEEPGHDAESMLVPASGEGFVPKPVIMGDYGAPVPGDVAVESAAAPEAEAAAEPDSAPLVAEPQEADTAPMAETVSDETVHDMPAEEPGGPEAAVLEDTLSAAEPMAAVEPMGAAADDTLAAGPDADATEPTGPDATAEAPSGIEDIPDDHGLPGGPGTSREPEPLDDLLAAIGDLVVPAAEPKAYSPGGLDMNDYTCEDCVYVGTCPKAKEDSPATCGSFQWKSV
jgi:hypothetical protein